MYLGSALPTSLRAHSLFIKGSMVQSRSGKFILKQEITKAEKKIRGGRRGGGGDTRLGLFQQLFFDIK